MYYNYSPYFGYVKKEDAVEILKKRNAISWIFAIFLSLIVVLIELFILPKLIELSNTVSIPISNFLYSNVRFGFYVAFLAAIIFTKPESEEEITAKLKYYKAGEMILISKLVSRQYEYKLIGIIFAVMAYLVFSTIMPIYTLTSTI